MKNGITTQTREPLFAAQNRVHLPLGLVGFRDLNLADIIYAEDQAPFMWLKDAGGEDTAFLVIEPDGLIDNYDIEISQQDVDFLELSSPQDALILNICTLVSQDPLKITVNLVGPIVVNRQTRKGKQVVLANHAQYSARHLLFGDGATQEEN